MLITILIPALNEAASIGVVVKKGIKALAELKMEGEVLVADNGSKDDTVAIARTSGARVVAVKQRGYGAAIQEGLKLAQGRYIIMADADGTYNLLEIAPFIEQLQNGYDLVVGNRFAGAISPQAMPFLNRYLGTPVLTFILNLFFNRGIGDINCGMRAISREACSRLEFFCPGMEFASEMLIEASLKNLRITQVPCNLYCSQPGRKPHLNSWRDGWRHLRLIIHSRFKK